MSSSPDPVLTDIPATRSTRPLEPGLYLVATPIGNLDDITLRALRVLREADRIACEDTRTTAKLLHSFGISTPTVSYHAHNESGRAEDLLEQLRAGARIALVSDAGTPAISDPGTVLVEQSIAAGIRVIPIPGASAVLNALIASGLPTAPFRFLGFLPSRAGARRSALEAARDTPAPVPETVLWYESPHRILETLADLEAVFGPTHPIVLARELTKLHEEFLRGPVADLRSTLAARDTVRGEFVLLLPLGLAPAPAGDTAAPPASIPDSIRALLSSGLTEKEALKQVARDRGLGKSEIYREWQRHR